MLNAMPKVTQPASCWTMNQSLGVVDYKPGEFPLSAIFSPFDVLISVHFS